MLLKRTEEQNELLNTWTPNIKTSVSRVLEVGTRCVIYHLNGLCRGQPIRCVTLLSKAKKHYHDLFCILCFIVASLLIIKQFITWGWRVNIFLITYDNAFCFTGLGIVQKIQFFLLGFLFFVLVPSLFSVSDSYTQLYTRMKRQGNMKCRRIGEVVNVKHWLPSHWRLGWKYLITLRYLFLLYVP